jgi:hypothetical protein
MKCLIWNSDGMGDCAKHHTIYEVVKEHKLDSVILLETERSNLVAPFLKHLAGGIDFIWYCLPP